MLDTYEQGYHKALIDVCDWFDLNSDNLKLSKAYSAKRIPVILKGLRDGHEVLRTYGGYCGMWIDKDWKEAKLLGYKERKERKGK